jgi:gluconokinase
MPYSRIVVMGVAGSGKTTIGTALARRVGAAFCDGDDLHPPANVAKMRDGQPLTDADRRPWLDAVGRWLCEGGSDSTRVVACSALKRTYRDRLRSACGGDVTFIYLRVDEKTARKRLRERKGHYMPVSLLENQFATLEEPVGEHDVITVDPSQNASTTDAKLSSVATGAKSANQT